MFVSYGKQQQQLSNWDRVGYNGTRKHVANGVACISGCSRLHDGSVATSVTREVDSIAFYIPGKCTSGNR